MSAIDEYVDVDDNDYFIDKNAIKLVDSNYDELDFYKKILYKHYSNCLVTIIHHTDLLITNFKDSLNYLQPIFLEYSYSKDDYRKYRQIIKDLERQFKTFENRFSLSTPLSNEHFSQYSQSVLCISNQIKCYINRLIDLLSHSDNPTINNQVALIFSRSLHLCTHITYYTRHCRLDKNLFIRPHHIIEHFCKNDIISYILGYEYLSHQIKFEDDASELSDIFKSRYFRNEFAVNDYCLNRQKKEQFPKDIKLKINNILHDINCFDLLTETVTAKSIHKKDLEEKYIEITNGIEQYIFEIKNIIISFLINFHLDVTPIFLDYSNSKISFKDYLSSINLVQNFYDHLDYLKSYDDFEVFLEKLIVIMGGNGLFR